MRPLRQLAAARHDTLAAIDGQRWAEALVSARDCCALAEKTLPPAAPARGVEWLRLAKLCAHEGRIAEAVEGWRRAKNVLAISHGPCSRLVHALEEGLRAAQAEQAATGADGDEDDTLL